VSFWEEFFPALLSGFTETLAILAVAIPVSIAWGVVLGSARVYGNRLVSLIAAGIVGLFRGFPLVVTGPTSLSTLGALYAR